MSPAPLTTPLTKLFKIKHPVLLAGMSSFNLLPPSSQCHALTTLHFQT